MLNKWEVLNGFDYRFVGPILSLFKDWSLEREILALLMSLQEICTQCVCCWWYAYDHLCYYSMFPKTGSIVRVELLVSYNRKPCYLYASSQRKPSETAECDSISSKKQEVGFLEGKVKNQHVMLDYHQLSPTFGFQLTIPHWIGKDSSLENAATWKKWHGMQLVCSLRHASVIVCKLLTRFLQDGHFSLNTSCNSFPLLQLIAFQYGCESKCKAPIHTLNPQADPYPRSIPKRRWSRPIHTSGSPRADPCPNFDATPYVVQHNCTNFYRFGWKRTCDAQSLSWYEVIGRFRRDWSRINMSFNPLTRQCSRGSPSQD